MRVEIVLIDHWPGAAVASPFKLRLKGEVKAEVRAEAKIRLRYNPLQPISAPRLRTRAPQRVVKPFIFAAVFKPEREKVSWV